MNPDDFGREQDARPPDRQGRRAGRSGVQKLPVRQAQTPAMLMSLL